MSNLKLKTNLFEEFSNITVNNDTHVENKATLPVDHCRIRPLTEIKSSMCQLPPQPTTVCIQPAVPQTTQVGDRKRCARYRYESPDKIVTKIKDVGYYVFRNMIATEELNVAKEYFYDHKVNYNRLRDEFIRPFMLNKVGNEMNKKLVNIKYRASNNNNSSDAGVFHRDLHIKSGESRVSNFTVLTYIDGGVMELIPRSNRMQNIDIFDVSKYYDSRVSIDLNPGDVLIFEMATIHRGIFYKKQANRRLIQLFDTVYEEDLDYFLKTTIHVPCKDRCSKKISDYFINVHKNKVLTNMANSFLFYNTAIGYTKLPISMITSRIGVKYISTESNQPRVVIEHDTFQKDNLYSPNFEIVDMSMADRERFLFLAFFLNNILIIVLIIVILTILILAIKLAIKNK